MKIVHLSTHDARGGAGSAAWRLHQALRLAGEDSRMVVRTAQHDDLWVRAVDEGGRIAAWHERLLTPWLQQHGAVGMPWFTVGAVEVPIEHEPWLVEAEVIHLHWVSEWLSVSAIRRLALLGKPLVWTCHDLWPVTGGSHYAGSNAPMGTDWQSGAGLPEPLRSISEREFERKRAQWADLPITVVSPSRWLGDVVRRSAVGRRWKVETVANGVDTGIFCPADRATARRRWGIPEGKVVLLFGCAALNDPRKGFAALRQALAGVSAERALLVLFGAETIEIDFPSLHVGCLSSEEKMASLYQSADAFLCPVLEDNLPTTVVEALACGIPAIGFATGGVVDLVEEDVTGLLAPCGDAAALGGLVSRFLEDDIMRSRLQGRAQAADKGRFSLPCQVANLRACYERAISAGAAACVRDPLEPLAVPPVWLPTELDWMTEATAAASIRAAEREQALSEKLAKAREKLQVERAKKQKLQAPARRRWWQCLKKTP